MKIDFVNNVKTYYSNSDYNPFNQNSGAYYITKQTLEDIYEDNKKKEVIKHKILGVVLGNIALFTALGTYVLFKGLPVGINKKLSKLSEKLKERMYAGRESSSKFYERTLKWTNKKIDQSRSVNNFTSFKDLLFKKIMYKTKFTRKIHDGITKLFERLSRNTVERKYGVFEDAFADFSKRLDNISLKDPNKSVTINGITKTAKEWLNEANTIRTATGQKLKTNFGAQKRESRYNLMTKINEDLEEKVLAKSREGISSDAKLKENLTALKDSDIAQSFIAEDILASEKLNLNRDVEILKRSITHSIEDNYKSVKELLDNISKCIDVNDKLSKDTISLIEGNLRTYKKLSGPMEQQYRENTVETMLGSIRALKETIAVNKIPYDDKTRKSIQLSLEEIEKIFLTDQKGDIQELLTIYRNILPEKEYHRLRTRANKVISKFDMATKTETDDFFDKLRDLKLGSAPTDVISMITPMITVGLGLGLAKDKDERISAALKYGIPVVGGITTTLIMTTSLISGFKGLAAGVLSSIILGEIGDAADKLRKNIKKRMDELQTNEQIIQQENVLENKLEQAA